ncbi:MAG: DNRLRE domain-containing protein [Candidatus Sumerlaeaceae bacterium]
MVYLKRIAGLAFSGMIAAAVTAATVDVPASKDATLYEDATGSLANGAGEHFFAGRVNTTGGGKLRRGVIAFDVAASVPAGSTISGATLKLTMTKSPPGASLVSIHAVTADWGQGTSDAAANEGSGIAATTSDATWTKRFFNTASDWTAAGGDFNATPSATTSVDVIGLYTWTSAATLSNVQGWFASPATNFGWLVRGDESVLATATRYSTKESPTTGNRPVLTITYTPPSSVNEWSLY